MACNLSEFGFITEMKFGKTKIKSLIIVPPYRIGELKKPTAGLQSDACPQPCGIIAAVQRPKERLVNKCHDVGSVIHLDLTLKCVKRIPLREELVFIEPPNRTEAAQAV